MWGKIKLFLKNKYREVFAFLRNKKLLISSLGVLSFVSFLTTFGGVMGYFFSRWFFGRFFGRSWVKSWILKIGRYRFHFHHWLVGLSLLLLGIFDVIPLLKGAIFQGVIIGLIFHDIFDTSEWHKVIRRTL
jgi:hypothetical protein